MNLILRSPDQTKCEGGKPVKTRKVPSRQTPPAATSDKKPGAKRCGVSGLETPPDPAAAAPSSELSIRQATSRVRW